LLSAKEKVWLVNRYNELQFNNYYNLLTMFSIFWSITSLLAFDIRTVSAKTVNIFLNFLTVQSLNNFNTDNSHLQCLKIREFWIQNVVGDHFSSPNMEIKKKSGLPSQRYIGVKVHSLKCVFSYTGWKVQCLLLFMV
jgi:hypothetical protein